MTDLKNATEILVKVRERITDDSDLLWTSFETADELRQEIDGLICRLQQNDNKAIDDIYTHFLPTSTFQEHSIQNGWSDEYMKLADEFDKVKR